MAGAGLGTPKTRQSITRTAGRIRGTRFLMTSILMLMYGPVAQDGILCSPRERRPTPLARIVHLEDDRIQRYQFEAWSCFFRPYTFSRCSRGLSVDRYL